MAGSVLPEKLEDVFTPAFVVDVDKVKANCSRMFDRCKQIGLSLRPHMKTHKTLELGEIMTNGTKRCIAVSTVQEAEFFASGGFDDILYAVPIVEGKISRCMKLLNHLKSFHVMIDSKYGVDALKRNSPAAEGKHWSVFVAINTGYGREGTPWNEDSSVELVKYVKSQEDIMDFVGCYSHCGSSYDGKSSDEVRQIASTHAERMVSIVEKLKSVGIDVPTFGTGSTPSCSRLPESASMLTEVHPGNYVFYDVQQSRIGSCSIEDIACQVVTTVIGHYPNNNMILVDCGFTALTKQSEGQLKQGYCVIQDHPNLKLFDMTQEVGKITAINGKVEFDKYPIGSKLKFFPYHACATSAMYTSYYIIHGDKVIAKYKPTRGW